ncbi:NUDIX hydrolase [Corynebacterium tapiri]|uniref:NUDIX hydrolase n=1 Tax=Corynebacterium tapiri TaxID=1448266 RepID=UPI0015D5ABBF|nr:CoA pyrophosphatase [Corynebacterium tapiri]
MARLPQATAYARNLLGVDEQNPPRGKRAAAVLLLFAGDSRDEAQLLLTHRSPTMRSHPGQIALPGGRVDPEDRSVVACALREAWEETAARAEDITPLGVLGALHVSANNHPVHPVLAHWHSPSPVFPHSEVEVDDVFSASVDELLAQRIQVGAGNYRGPAFWHNGYLVWGFTASVIESVLVAAEWAEELDPHGPVEDLAGALDASRNQERRR